MFSNTELAKLSPENKISKKAENGRIVTLSCNAYTGIFMKIEGGDLPESSLISVDFEHINYIAKLLVSGRPT